MTKITLTFIFLAALLYGCSSAQTFERVVVFNEDPHTLYNFETSDTNQLFYLKLVPKTTPIGCLVILPSSGELIEDVMRQMTLHQLAVDQGLLVIFPSINWGSNTFAAEHIFLDKIFQQVIDQYKVPKDQFFLGGLSGGGMVSLTYAEKAKREPGKTCVVPKAVFALDPPLDLAHLYKHAERDVEKNVLPAAVNEGRWIMDMYRTEFGGSPEEVPLEYVKYSIYSHSEKDGGNAKYLLQMPIRIYTEPAIEWQMKNRHRDLYDLNCTDISAMINMLQLQGNERAEMIVTYNKGVRLDGTRHPHSWSIMDSKECLDWLLNQMKNN
jgi:hypothetical protein